MKEHIRPDQPDHHDEPFLGGERPEIEPDAIARHFHTELQYTSRLTPKVLETTITDIHGEKQQINPMRVRSIKLHKEKTGHFHLKHKGVIFTVTGAALLAAAAEIRIRQKNKNK